MFNTYSMNTYVLLHFEHKYDVTIIFKLSSRGTSRIHRYSWNKCFRPCLHDIGSLFVSDWGFVYTALHESDTLCSNNPIQFCSASAGGTKIDPVQSVLFCFTCKHRNPIRNAPKRCFDIWWLQYKWSWSIAWEIGKENNKYGRRNEIVLARNSVTGLLSRLRVNTHTPERFLYRIWQQSETA